MADVRVLVFAVIIFIYINYLDIKIHEYICIYIYHYGKLYWNMKLLIILYKTKVSCWYILLYPSVSIFIYLSISLSTYMCAPVYISSCLYACFISARQGCSDNLFYFPAGSFIFILVSIIIIIIIISIDLCCLPISFHILSRTWCQKWLQVIS